MQKVKREQSHYVYRLLRLHNSWYYKKTSSVYFIGIKEINHVKILDGDQWEASSSWNARSPRSRHPPSPPCSQVQKVHHCLLSIWTCFFYHLWFFVERRAILRTLGFRHQTEHLQKRNDWLLNIFVLFQCFRCFVDIRVHRKKIFSIFPSAAGISLTKLSLGGNNLYMTLLFPPRESLVSEVTSWLGTGISKKAFFTA